MPNPEDFVGKYIQYKIPDGGNATGAGANQSGVVTTAFERKAVTVVNAPGAAASGPSTPWSFTFLKYEQGSVTTCDQNGGVLTGPLSGCWVFSYSQGGQRKLAHIGTLDSPTHQASITVKNNWRRLIGSAPAATNIEGNNPAQLMGDAETHVLFGQIGGSPYDIKVCAYFENGKAWTILTCREAGMTKIVKVKKMPLVPWSRAEQILTFK